ncbi:septum formation protein [Methylobacterium sp. PvP062]|jgi:septum formation protein|uniref:Nucleoside triphosphate pyrophosphatase n=1 Tax=Methylobacterium radiotolerans (strain ATCC 27329 / DSM 1819 / JCM 2831 / NBRC 15690 / NCIMB 10815 / 0-1) TaxID=426355 RepID=B1M3B4_METRJ|nr:MULTISPECIES: Maf family nucleotide pyrophosphatase [Methylobacterium]MCX7330797.1 Maf family nucleotide pyrophosphatase [Hyphomicrobiales bacterium]GAN52026.1 maf protein [Methylobacterium sp. ME121]ACB26254.1 maf protein [Methylobacterium radiotolerans JCM 2831]KZC02962.1 Maf-like protein YceF [Methylobacterium radiotolerans]MBN6822081.1 septum formation protein Maf [Methylobacterium organophilum]
MPRSPWTGPQPLLLASTSPTRRLLLESAALPVETASPDVDERALEAARPGLSPPDLALALARAKAEAVAARFPGRIVLGADQVLDCDGTVFHKPADAEAARAQLARLSGRTHALHSAVALAGAVADAFVETARLTLRPLDERAIAAYVDCAGAERVRSSVGGYQLEGPGIHLFESVAGDHSTVLGLPLLPLLARLRAAGYLAF